VNDNNQNRLKKIPTGFDDFGDVIKQRYFYVDKTLFIRELIDNRSFFNLFTRPRRFGKSLNISMFQYFFDNLYIHESHVFDGLAISREDNYYKSYQNQFPVIKMTLKGAEGLTFDAAFKRLKSIISNEFIRHNYLLNSNKLSELSIKTFKAIESEEASLETFEGSLKFLSDLLYQHYNQKVIILIDEYDVPIQKAHKNDYYTPMISFVRNFFGDALKTNPSLFFSVVTGCLRVSKDSIFTGINNLNVLSITSNAYSEYFGFTEDEVKNLLEYYELGDHLSQIRDWYNGYLFGNSVVYNPWSAIKYVYDLRHGHTFPQSYWANTSSNDIVKTLIDIADLKTKEEIEILVAGGTLLKPIKEDIVYAEITDSMDNLWNFLFFTGYLKKVNALMIDTEIHYELKIPNKEICYIFNRHIKEWFKAKAKVKNIQCLYQSIVTHDVATMEYEISKYLLEVISYMDNAENFYHGFLSGILRSMDDHQVKSNRESGDGRSDIFILPNFYKKQAYVIEIKVARKASELELKCEEALAQIDEKRYVEELALEGYLNVVKYGMAFYKKTCMVKMASLE